MKPSQYTRDFLETLLFVADNPDEDARPLEDKSIFDFSPDFVEAVDTFVYGFQTFLANHYPELHVRSDECQRSFGGNVFFSLSGHGCGFFDEWTENPETGHNDGSLGDALQSALVEFAGGNKYRFEQLESNLSENDDGKIDLSFIPSAIAEYRKKYFSDGVKFAE